MADAAAVAARPFDSESFTAPDVEDAHGYGLYSLERLEWTQEGTGRANWLLLHRVAEYAWHAQPVSALRALLRAYAMAFACQECRAHFRGLLLRTPPPASWPAAGAWMRAVHDVVNARLRKPLFGGTHTVLPVETLRRCFWAACYAFVETHPDETLDESEDAFAYADLDAAMRRELALMRKQPRQVWAACAVRWLLRNYPCAQCGERVAEIARRAPPVSTVCSTRRSMSRWLASLHASISKSVLCSECDHKPVY